MKTVHTTNELTWVHISNPSKEEIRSVADEYGIHLRTAEELLLGNITSKVDLFDDYIYLVLRFPRLHRNHIDSFEIDCVLTKNTLISVSYEEIPTISSLERAFDTNAILKQKKLGSHAGYLLYFLLSRLYQDVSESLVISERQLDRLEAEVFAGNHREMVKELSQISRVLVDANQVLSDHQAALPALEAAGQELLGESFQYRLHRIKGEYKRVITKINQLKETLSEVRHTNDSLLTTGQNEVMKILTVVAFLTMPLSLIASIFEMETTTKPIIGHPNDFWIIIGIMVFLTLIAFAYFRYKKWI